MSKHTPGPWVVTTGVKEHDVVTSTHDGVGLDDDVCEVYGGNDDDVSVRRANARLIAAAPDLLAFVREEATSDLPVDCPTNALARHRILKARALLAKATGGDHE